METPMKLSDGEKLILMMLSDIYEKVGVKGELDPAFVREAIYSGNAWGLTWKYPGIFDSQETSDQVRSEVVNLLDMWSFLEEGYKRLSKKEKARVNAEAAPLGDNVRFPGFDGNNESEYGNVMRFLIGNLDRFQSFKGREDLNSHMPSLDAYRRMFAVFEPLRSQLGMRSEVGLTASEIIEILKARIHPNRRAA
jgi:uncharacterized protein